MIESEIEIRTLDGTAGGLLYQPEEKGSWPGVFFFTDISGIRASQRAMAARICSEGYAVLMPNLYYRTGKPPLFEPGLNFGDEKFTKRMAELLSPLTTEAVERDAGSYVDFLAQQHFVKKRPFGAVGLCVSGATALRIAAVRPDQIAAGASFTGAAFTPMRQPVLTFCCPESRLGSILGMQPTTKACRRPRSTISTVLWSNGAESMRVKSTMERTDGPLPTAPPTTRL